MSYSALNVLSVEYFRKYTEHSVWGGCCRDTGEPFYIDDWEYAQSQSSLFETDSLFLVNMEPFLFHHLWQVILSLSKPVSVHHDGAGERL